MTRGAWLVVLSVVLSACGGGGESPKSPDDVAEAEGAESVEGDPAGGDEAESADGESGPEGAEAESGAGSGKEASSKEAANEEVSSEDRTKILQLVLEDEELSRFLKLGEPGRFPLKVSGKDVPSGATKGGKPVEVVDGPKSEKDAVLVVTKFEIDGKTATVSYRYDVEGIRGTTRVSRGPSGWELKSSRIVER